jgi:hypothetical protein
MKAAKNGEVARRWRLAYLRAQKCARNQPYWIEMMRWRGEKRRSVIPRRLCVDRGYRHASQHYQDASCAKLQPAVRHNKKILGPESTSQLLMVMLASPPALPQRNSAYSVSVMGQ